MNSFRSGDTQMTYMESGTKNNMGGPVFLWAHGWGQSHKSMAALADGFKAQGRHIMVDFPGFGTSPPPEDVWGTAEYADFMAAFLRAKLAEYGQDTQKVVWIGHSFGCRVGVQIAARHPDLIAGLFLVAAAGLPRKRPLWQKLYFRLRIALFKGLKKLIPYGLPEDWLMKRFASADYKNAGPMRKILVRVVNENLSQQAAQITCPVKLVYGTNDTETPPEIGEKYKALIKNAEMVHLAGFDHYTVLSDGRHQTAAQLKHFVQSLSFLSAMAS